MARAIVEAMSTYKTRHIVVVADGDTYAAPSLDEALDLAMLDETVSSVEWGVVFASDAGWARLMRPRVLRPVSARTLARYSAGQED